MLALTAAVPAAYARPLFGGANSSAAVNAAVNAAMASVQALAAGFPDPQTPVGPRS